jgi:hypothetical protein
MELSEKLYGFPKLYSISLEKDIKRRNRLIEQLLPYNVTNIHFNITKIFKEANEWWEGDDYVKELCEAGRSVTINHLKNINLWLNTTDDPYAFFCEDDISFETVQYWNFSWLEFINALPKNWECIQLHVVRTHYIYPLTEVALNLRQWYDWSAAGYIMKRSYAKKLLDFHLTKQGIFRLISQIEIPYFDPINTISTDLHRYPYPEHIIFSKNNNVYSIPLLLENVDLGTTRAIDPEKSDDLAGHGPSYNSVKKWWSKNPKHTLKDIIQY